LLLLLLLLPPLPFKLHRELSGQAQGARANPAAPSLLKRRLLLLLLAVMVLPGRAPTGQASGAPESAAAVAAGVTAKIASFQSVSLARVVIIILRAVAWLARSASAAAPDAHEAATGDTTQQCARPEHDEQMMQLMIPLVSVDPETSTASQTAPQCRIFSNSMRTAATKQIKNGGINICTAV
jgi:hypothetical protein